jgi:queuosine biosynthesis protein QueD
MLVARIAKRYTFDAAHRLPDHDGKCRDLHGHTYGLEIVCAHEVRDDPGHPKDGMALDFGELDAVAKKLVDELDHTYLNESLAHRSAWPQRVVHDPPISRVEAWDAHPLSPGADAWEVPAPTTSENIAAWFLTVLDGRGLPVEQVTVSETPRTGATVNRRGAGLPGLGLILD